MLKTTGKLKVSEELYRWRINNLKKCLDHKLPPSVIAHSVALVNSCFAFSLPTLWHSLKMKHFPHWLLYLTDKDYREACREPEVDEEELKKMLGI